MARETVSTIGKMLYGFVFVVVLPLLPIAWASLTKKESHAPDVRALSIRERAGVGDHLHHRPHRKRARVDGEGPGKRRIPGLDSSRDAPG